MNKRIEHESENNTKKVCYLIITHAIHVDALGHIFDFMKHHTNVPRTIFSAKNPLEKEREHKPKMLEYVINSDYDHPAFCSISGFKVNMDGLFPVFSRYMEHTKEFDDTFPESPANKDGVAGTSIDHDRAKLHMRRKY